MAVLSGLQSPPPGYVYSPERRARQLAALRKDGAQILHGFARSIPGRLPGSVSADDAPTLVQGRDALPALCSCGSRFLLAEPPLGQHRRGSVTCQTCSKVVAWLAPPLVAPRPAPASVTAAAPQALGRTTVVATSFATLPGCGVACSAAYGHDPITHESYGRAAALTEQASKPHGQRQLGPLCVDFDAGRAQLHGAELLLTPIEHDIVSLLMARAGELVSANELISQVWGTTYTRLSTGGGGARPLHLLRVNMGRIRSKLGEAATLIETVPGRGYRLNLETTT